jgi:glycosyltransferase involved in cell wall biosynthesis
MLPPRLRIGLYFSAPPAGGMERHALALLDRLDRQRYDLVVFYPQSAWPVAFREALRRRGVRLAVVDNHVFPGMEGRSRAVRWMRVAAHAVRGIFIVLKIRKELAAARLDLIHFHAGRLGNLYAPILASLLARVPCRLITLHNPLKKNPRLQRLGEGLILRAVHRFIAVSSHVKEVLARNKAVRAERIVVVPNGIECSETSANLYDRREARRRLGLREAVPVIGAVGRLHRLKGLDLLIRATPIVRAEIPSVQIVLIGSGQEEEELRRLAAEQGVAAAVLFAGFHADAGRLMPAVDVLAVPSRHEGQSISILEAMACARPVVAANVGGIPELVVDGVTGILVPSEDAEALARALVRLLKDSGVAERMGKAGQERVAGHFSQAATIDRTFSIYEALLQRRSGRKAAAIDTD